jgi:hypothetical protein
LAQFHASQVIHRLSATAESQEIAEKEKPQEEH